MVSENMDPEVPLTDPGHVDYLPMVKRMNSTRRCVSLKDHLVVKLYIIYSIFMLNIVQIKFTQGNISYVYPIIRLGGGADLGLKPPPPLNQ